MTTIVEEANVNPNPDQPAQDPPSNPDKMLFQSIKYEQIYFQNMLDPMWRDPQHVVPKQIVKTRNTKIILCYLEVVMDIFAIVFLILRQSRVTIIFTVGNLIFLVLGIWASLRLNFYGLVAHTCWTLGIVGGFVVYKIIDTVLYMNLDRDAANQDTGQIDRSTVRIISTLPQLTILAIGVYGCILVLRLDEEIEARKKHEMERSQRINQADAEAQGGQPPEVVAPNDSNVAEMQPQDIQVEVLVIDPKNMGTDKCVYCQKNKKEIVFYPCGHKCLCESCNQLFMKQANHMVCPICKNRIKDMIKAYT